MTFPVRTSIPAERPAEQVGERLLLLPRPSSPWTFLIALAGVLALAACDSTSPRPSSNDPRNPDLFENCVLSTDRLIDSGVGKDGIPALTNPPLVGPNAKNAEYLADSSRVIGLLVGDPPWPSRTTSCGTTRS